jgi:hypothetical protein
MVLSESEAFGSSGPDIIGMQEPKNNQVSDLKSALTGYGFYGVDVDEAPPAVKPGFSIVRADLQNSIQVLSGSAIRRIRPAPNIPMRRKQESLRG